MSERRAVSRRIRERGCHAFRAGVKVPQSPHVPRVHRDRSDSSGMAGLALKVVTVPFALIFHMPGMSGSIRDFPSTTGSDSAVSGHTKIMAVRQQHGDIFNRTKFFTEKDRGGALIFFFALQLRCIPLMASRHRIFDSHLAPCHDILCYTPCWH